MLQKPDPGISATPHENNLRYFNVVIAGPQDSAYDGAPVIHSRDDVQLAAYGGSGALPPYLWGLLGRAAGQWFLKTRAGGLAPVLRHACRMRSLCRSLHPCVLVTSCPFHHLPSGPPWSLDRRAAMWGVCFGAVRLQ